MQRKNETFPLFFIIQQKYKSTSVLCCSARKLVLLMSIGNCRGENKNLFAEYYYTQK